MFHRIRQVIPVFLFVLALVAMPYRPALAQNLFCDYTMTTTLTNDQTGGHDIVALELTMSFPSGTIVEGTVHTGFIFQPAKRVAVTFPFGATQTFSVTLRANAVSTGVAHRAIYLNSGTETFGLASVISSTMPTVANCSEEAVVSGPPGIKTGGYPVLIVPDTTGNIVLWDFDTAANAGYRALTLDADLLAKFTAAPPAKNTVIATSANGKVRFSVLTTGEYQVNYGPDIDGKESVIVFNAAGQVTNKYDFNLYSLGH